MSKSILPYYIDIPEERQELARKVLREETGLPIDDTMADACVEQIWNALVGHPLAADEAA